MYNHRQQIKTSQSRYYVATAFMMEPFWAVFDFSKRCRDYTDLMRQAYCYRLDCSFNTSIAVNLSIFSVKLSCYYFHHYHRSYLTVNVWVQKRMTSHIDKHYLSSFAATVKIVLFVSICCVQNAFELSEQRSHYSTLSWTFVGWDHSCLRSAFVIWLRKDLVKYQLNGVLCRRLCLQKLQLACYSGDLGFYLLLMVTMITEYVSKIVLKLLGRLCWDYAFQDMKSLKY